MASGQPVKLNIFVGERTVNDFNFLPQSMWVCVWVGDGVMIGKRSFS